MAIKVKIPNKKKRPAYHDANGKFKPGVCANPAGRPRGSLSGRAQALGILDKILGESQVQSEMEKGLRDYILAKPVTAFRALVIPLVPKEQIMKLESETRTPVRIVFDDSDKE